MSAPSPIRPVNLYAVYVRSVAIPMSLVRWNVELVLRVPINRKPDKVNVHCVGQGNSMVDKQLLHVRCVELVRIRRAMDRSNVWHVKKEKPHHRMEPSHVKNVHPVQLKAVPVNRPVVLVHLVPIPMCLLRPYVALVWLDERNRSKVKPNVWNVRRANSSLKRVKNNVALVHRVVSLPPMVRLHVSNVHWANSYRDLERPCVAIVRPVPIPSSVAPVFVIRVPLVRIRR